MEQKAEATAAGAGRALTMRRAVVVVAGLNLAYGLIELAVALQIASVSLFADSIDFFEDGAVNILIAVALGWTAASRRRLGFGLALFLFLPALATLWIAVLKLFNPPPPNADMELYHQPTTTPGARLPHAWVYDRQGGKHSTLDLCGKGQFTLLTGIGGEGWVKAAEAVGKSLGLPVRSVTIGPRADYEDHVGDWHKVRDIRDGGCILVCPDQHVAWRSATASRDPAADLTRVLRAILGH